MIDPIGISGDRDVGAQPIYYGEIAPEPELRPWVAAYWHFRVVDEAGPIAHSVPPDGSVSLWCTSRTDGIGVLGPHVHPRITEVRGGDVLWGMRLWPGASGVLVDLDPRELRDRSIPPGWLDLGPWATPLAEALGTVDDEQGAARTWDSTLATVLPTRPALDARVMSAVFAIIRSRGTAAIPEVAAQVGLSPRQLRRRFVAAVGLTPKELARVRRLRASLVAVVGEADGPWVTLAAAFGYADQAHLIREYRAVVGLTPAALRTHLHRIEHGRLVDT